MSQLSAAARTRVQRSAAAAVERARLTLVPARRTPAPRAPFAVLVLAILGIGVVGLLMFNTHMQQTSFHATDLQNRADALAAEKQKLDMELEDLRNPQRLGVAARQLGMVVPPVPGFVSLKSGELIGDPTPATSRDLQPVNPRPDRLPAALRPEPIIKTVYEQPVELKQWQQDAIAKAKNKQSDGPASAADGAAAGTTGTPTDQGAAR